MRLALSRATVTAPDGTVHDKVQLLTSGGRMTLSDRSGRPVLVVEGVQVRRLDRLRWEVDAPEGTYGVTKEKGCGCGG